MHSSFRIAWLIIAFAWTAALLRSIYKQYRQNSRWNWVVLVAGFLTILGGFGFFAFGLVALGIIRPAASLEWPAGHVSNVVSLPDGKYAVGLMAAGRIQLYDSTWHFLRGWQVDAAGGDFTVVPAEGSLLNVYTARSRTLYVFSDSGKLLNSFPYNQEFADLPKGESRNVPTSLLLWPFSSPLGCWALGVIGMLGMQLAKRLAPGS